MRRIADELGEDGVVSPQRLISVGMALLGAALTGFVFYACWLTGQVSAQVASAQVSARDLRSALSEGDRAAAERSLRSLRRRVSDAESGERTVTWKVLGRVPGVRDEAQALTGEIHVLRELGDDGLAHLAPGPSGRAQP